MTETVVHVITLEQWKSVLDVWFKQGYKWNSGDKEYSGHLLRGNKYLVLQFFEGSHYIHCANEGLKSIEYSEFMAQQKEGKEVKTYYVTQEQLDLIENLGEYDIPFFHLATGSDEKIKNLAQEIPDNLDKPILRYLGGDETIEFKVKEQLYRLWATGQYGDKVYFTKGGNIWSTPATIIPKDIFTAPLEEIKKWQTPAWKIEKAD